MRNRDTGESKGFAFVAFKTKDEAQKAIEELHNKEFKVISASTLGFIDHIFLQLYLLF